ncbi:reverse transcriptase domain-containing protein [Tanacetum coccineum]
MKEMPHSNSKWRLYTDRASNSDGSGAWLMLIDPEGKEYTYALRFEFETTNNEAEYEALLAGLRIAREMEIAKVAIFLDSQLLVKTAQRGFEEYIVEHVRRNQNKKADALSKLASMTFEHLTKEVLVEVLTKRSIKEKEVLKVDMQERKSWMDPIHEYLLSGLFPKDTKEAKKIRIQAPQYKLIRETCTKDPSLHHGSVAEVAKTIQDYEKCKEQSATRKAGISGAIVAGSTWPFSHWGIHILGPLLMVPGGLHFLAIAIEHSTKWVEAKPLTTINGRQVEKFVWEYVVCRFGVPWIINSKEEKHFKEGMFADLCKGLNVTQSFSPVTEHMEIMNHIDKKLTRSQQGWVDNLAKTLWIHRTLPRNSQKETPFSLTYDSKAVILIIEATDDKGRVQKATKGKESKKMASIEKAYYRNKLRKCHSAGSILDYEDLKAKFRSHFSQHKKFTKTHLAVQNIKQRKGESTRAFITRYTDDTLQILGLNREQRISGFVHGLRTRSLVEHLSMDLPSTYKVLMEKTYTWVEAREVATNGASSDRRDSFERSKKGGTAMQRMGILVSTIHGAIKFHTKKGIGTVLSADETHEGTKRARKILSKNKERVLSHVQPIKQNKRGLGPDRNMAACKETEELTKAGILRKAKHQTWVANPVMVKKSDDG